MAYEIALATVNDQGLIPLVFQNKKAKTTNTGVAEAMIDQVLVIGKFPLSLFKTQR